MDWFRDTINLLLDMVDIPDTFSGCKEATPLTTGVAVMFYFQKKGMEAKNQGVLIL